MKSLFVSSLLLIVLYTGGALAQGEAPTNNAGKPVDGQADIPINIDNPGGPPGASKSAVGITGATAGTVSGAGVLPETYEQGEGMDVDVDTGSRASGAVDVDVKATTDVDTDASGVDPEITTGQQSGDTDSLPASGSEFPLVGLTGILALALGLGLRLISRSLVRR